MRFFRKKDWWETADAELDKEFKRVKAESTNRRVGWWAVNRIDLSGIKSFLRDAGVARFTFY